MKKGLILIGIFLCFVLVGCKKASEKDLFCGFSIKIINNNTKEVISSGGLTNNDIYCYLHYDNLSGDANYTIRQNGNAICEAWYFDGIESEYDKKSVKKTDKKVELSINYYFYFDEDKTYYTLESYNIYQKNDGTHYVDYGQSSKRVLNFEDDPRFNSLCTTDYGIVINDDKSTAYILQNTLLICLGETYEFYDFVEYDSNDEIIKETRIDKLSTNKYYSSSNCEYITIKTNGLDTLKENYYKYDKENFLGRYSDESGLMNVVEYEIIFNS